MNFLNPFFPRSTFLLKGGGGGGTPVMPAPPAPPATATAIEVTQSKIDAKRQAKAKTGIDATILGGAANVAAGGPLASGAAPGGVKNTLLGGG